MTATTNKNLRAAARAKNDEFYTQLTDIEKELGGYEDHFKGKVVFCNCDDPTTSNFWKYFELNFEFLGLKKLIATHYDPINPSYKLEIVAGSPDTIKTPLRLFGDFRDPECAEILQEADIVVTNPPFSLFREYVAQLIEHNKKFLILGNVNAITYKDIFPFIKDNKMWFGNSINGGSPEFRVPDDYPMNTSACRIGEDGKKYIRVKGVRWFTNLDYKKRHENLILYREYSPTDYPKYDNYDAINVDKTKDIPVDYEGPMGVPITFMDKYNPDQFAIIALGVVGSITFSCNKKMELLDKYGNPTGKYRRNAKGALYRSYNPTTDKKAAFRDCETGELYTSIYARIIIKRR